MADMTDDQIDAETRAIEFEFVRYVGQRSRFDTWLAAVEARAARHERARIGNAIAARWDDEDHDRWDTARCGLLDGLDIAEQIARGEHDAS